MNHQETVQNFISEAFNRGNLTIIQDTIHPDYRCSSPTDTMESPEELTGFIIALRAAFPDLHIAVTQQLESGSTVVTRIRFTGTHLGTFLDMPPTHRSVDIEGCIISQFKDGKILKEWEILDQLTLLKQLGAAA
ncbi:MAG: ester cyclase [Opitutales bacterium]|nr:ester cyclase [Opitutales bacterium]